ncbi:GGDEF domain-containing protein [Rhizobium sp. KVB221]|uniref:diguanylate cyclase n=1 Tax=Rhizobium setariae TaxID=2801340 RepID=A0A937CMT8_9HYPH|nr:GGDEF domain-containing protein [Rhizobium setariae]MBL0373086.1 GGDEF domain-containing protein [Rhizobium setariae]
MSVAQPQPKVQVPDIAAQVTYAMRQMGISPIPRNYELFYEAYIGSNPKLTRELAALGSRATQDELDAIGAQYFSQHQVNMVDGAHSRIVGELESLVTLLRQEHSSLESYNKLLGETYSRITSKSASSADLLHNAISLLSDATGSKMERGKVTMDGVEAKSREMEDIRKELDEYKKIANTDSLTRLHNRRAFDDRLAAIYDSPLGRTTTTLIIADIDNFKKINDTFGHPVGDKILATVANVIKSNLRKDVFVARTGGEEFAVILEGSSSEDAMIVAERVRRSLEATPFRNSKTGVNYGPVTLSLGLCLASEGDSPQDLYQKSDVALYCAKSNGRNRSVTYEDGMKKELSKSWLLYKK